MYLRMIVEGHYSRRQFSYYISVRFHISTVCFFSCKWGSESHKGQSERSLESALDLYSYAAFTVDLVQC